MERKRRMWREASKNSYYNNENYRKNENKRDIENYKTRYKKDASFRTKRIDYLLNRYRSKPEFREKSLVRYKAWRDSRKKKVIKKRTSQCIFSENNNLIHIVNTDKKYVQFEPYPRTERT